MTAKLDVKKVAHKTTETVTFRPSDDVWRKLDGLPAYANRSAVINEALELGIPGVLALVKTPEHHEEQLKHATKKRKARE